MAVNKLLEKEVQSIRSKRQIDLMLKRLETDKPLIDDFMNVFLQGNEKAAVKASWVLGHYGEKFPRELEPYLYGMVTFLKKKNCPDAIKRNVTRALYHVPIPENLEGECLDICYTLFLDRNQPIAVRVFAMKVIQLIAKKNPDLNEEFFAAIELELTHPVSAGFRNRAEKILKGIF